MQEEQGFLEDAGSFDDFGGNQQQAADDSLDQELEDIGQITYF